MRRLFVRLFLSVWISMTFSGAAFVVIEATAHPPRRVERRRALIRHGIMHEARLAARDAERDVDPSKRLEEYRRRTDAAIFLFSDDGRIFGPNEPSNAARRLEQRVRREGDSDIEKESAIMMGFAVDESSFIAIGRLPRTPAWARALGTDTLAQRLLVIFVVSGIVAWGLARYLTRPLESLRRATRRLAAGDLGVRVAPDLGSADAEIASLARDFDAMATRVEELLSTQQRLLLDVSHELNSPLARLRVALELARPGASVAATDALDRCEREVERIAAMVEEILTLTRTDPSRVEREELDLRALVEEIAADGDYEAQATDRRVRIVSDEAEWRVCADPGLLRRAIENVVRNAVRFTAPGTEVLIEVRRGEADETLVCVSDRGPGVPETALASLFEPFFRVETDRDRRTGGAGLGLAITERAITLQGGTVEAANLPEGGLRVTMRIPS